MKMLSNARLALVVSMAAAGVLVTAATAVAAPVLAPGTQPPAGSYMVGTDCTQCHTYLSPAPAPAPRPAPAPAQQPGTFKVVLHVGRFYSASLTNRATGRRYLVRVRSGVADWSNVPRGSYLLRLSGGPVMFRPTVTPVPIVDRLIAMRQYMAPVRSDD